MKGGGSQKRVLLLAGVFVIITLALTAWVSTSRESESLKIPIGQPGHGPVSDLGSTASEEASTRTAPAAPPVTTVDASPADASGRLRIHCVDEVTGHAVPGLTWVVASERGGDKLHGTGVADDSGRAHIESLPENTLLVFTLRKPPHAPAFSAVWLRRGETKDVEVRVGRGASVQGKVVDDLLHPLADVEVLVNNDYAPPFLKYEDPTTTKVAARTDAEGHYVVDNVASQPRAVWVVDGEARPESWGEVVVMARLANSTGQAGASVRPGEKKDLPDIVLPRLRTWRGRVVDADGRAVASAVLTVNMGRLAARRIVRGTSNFRARPPGSEGFKLLPGEALTRIDGSFDLSSGEPLVFATVLTSSGTGQPVQLPSLEPGASVDDLLITLKPVSAIALVLTDPDGKPAGVPNPGAFRREHNVYSTRTRAYDALRLVLSMGPDEFERAQVIDDGAGGYIAQIDGRIQGARSYTLMASGWSTKSGLLVSLLQDGGQLHIQLEPPPYLRVHVRVRGAKKAEDPKANLHVSLHACLLPTGAAVERGPQCCGLGSRASIPLVDGELDVLLPVDVRRPFHVSTRIGGPGIGRSAVDQGVCYPDGDPLVIDLDASDVAGQTEAPAAKTPPARTEPGVSQRVGTVRATVVDLVSGKPVSSPDLYLDMIGPGPGKHHFGPNTQGNQIMDRKVPVGAWRGRVKAAGYRTVTDLAVVVREGETTDLGRIALEPAPRTRIVVLEADGRPVARYGAVIRILDEEGTQVLENGRPIEGDDGSILSFADLPEHLLVQVSQEQTNLQWIQVRKDPEATVVELGPWRDVDVRVTGTAALLPGSSIDIRVWPESFGPPTGDTSARDRSGLMPCRTQELEVGMGNPRLFRCRLGPGRYVVEGSSPLFQVVSRAFEVTAGDGPVRVEVDSTE